MSFGMYIIQVREAFCGQCWEVTWEAVLKLSGFQHF